MITEIKEVSSLDEPGVSLYRTLKKPLSHRELGVFIVEGDKVVERFFESGLTVISVLLTEAKLEIFKDVLNRKQENIDVYLVTPELLKEIVGFRYHQGIMAAGLVPESASIDEIIKNTTAPRLFVALDRLESAENTGVIVRNCTACGCQALLVGRNSTDPFLRRSVRNSMGAIFKIPVIYSCDLPLQLRYLREKSGFTIIAAHPGYGCTPLYEADLTGNCCIVFGNEGEGLSEEVLDACDARVKVPMVQGIDSLNVAASSAVFLYEAMKQRICRNSVFQ
jgi:tRNA G18 (ribose-2'-O)-methylase SpoU